MVDNGQVFDKFMTSGEDFGLGMIWNSTWTWNSDLGFTKIDILNVIELYLRFLCANECILCLQVIVGLYLK